MYETHAIRETKSFPQAAKALAFIASVGFPFGLTLFSTCRFFQSDAAFHNHKDTTKVFPPTVHKIMTQVA